GGHSSVVPVRLPCRGRRRRLSLGTGPLGVLTACWVRADLDDRMRLNNWSIAASYYTARIFAGLGFGSSTARQVDHLAPAPHRPVLFIAPDLRGFADSDKPYADYMPATIAQDMLELADAEDADRFHILSHDLGGPPSVALAYTAGKRALHWQPSRHRSSGWTTLAISTRGALLASRHARQHGGCAVPHRRAGGAVPSTFLSRLRLQPGRHFRGGSPAIRHAD